MTSPFWTEFHRAREGRRQSRLDVLQEDMNRGQMALREAADRRAELALRERQQNAETLRERLGYLDRMKVLGRETQPFATLLGKYPESGASPFTGKAYELDELLAREPEKAEERTPLAVPWAEGQQPTFREERHRNIDSAYERFGGAAEAQRKAAAALKERLVGAKTPKTTALDIQLRAVEAKAKQADLAERGLYMDPNGMVKEILDPEERRRAAAQAPRMRAQAIAERQRLIQAYQQAGATSPVQMGPSAMYQQLQEQGMEEAEIARQLGSMFSDQELQADGFEIGD